MGTTTLTSAASLPNQGGGVTSYNDLTEKPSIAPFANNSIILPKAQNSGLKIDEANPAFGWGDITGILYPDLAGADAPTLSAFRAGAVRRYAYAANDKMDCEFHIPHDYAMGTDVFIHVHWSHNGTAISGNAVFNLTHTYAKGHNQGVDSVYPAEKTVSITYPTVDIATTPRYIHRVDEVQLSTAGGSATLMDTNKIEPDGVIGVNFIVATAPTITGGSPNDVFVFHIDLHYQSTQVATKNKTPNFWA